MSKKFIALWKVWGRVFYLRATMSACGRAESASPMRVFQRVYADTAEDVCAWPASDSVGFLRAKSITEITDAQKRKRSQPEVASALSAVVEVSACRNIFSPPDVMSSGNRGGQVMIDIWREKSIIIRENTQILLITLQFGTTPSTSSQSAHYHAKSAFIVAYLSRYFKAFLKNSVFLPTQVGKSGPAAADLAALWVARS